MISSTIHLQWFEQTVVRSANQGELKGKKSVCRGVLLLLLLFIYFFMCLAIEPEDKPLALTGDTGEGICKYTYHLQIFPIAQFTVTLENEAGVALVLIQPFLLY